jgi:hypothetical protein
MFSEKTVFNFKDLCTFRSIGLVIAIFFSAQLFAVKNYEIGQTRLFKNRDFYIPTSAESYNQPATPPVPDSVQEMVNEINGLSALVEEEGRFIDRLDALYQVTYPVGITKVIGGQNYTIVLDCDEITPEGAFINAYMSFPIPQTGRQIAFMANHIPLTAEGGLNGVIELALLADEPINLGANSRMIIYGRDNSSGNYRTKVHFDCDGFVDMTIDAGIEFSPNVFVREDPETGEQKPDTPLTANFVTTIQSWSDLIVEVSLPPFQLKSLKGFGFEVQQAAFDFSDLNNPAGIVFPQNYSGLEAYGDLPELWQGFYFRQLILRLPPELKEGERIQIMAQNLILDEEGLSGTFAAENLLDLEHGTIGGWAFSLDRVELNLVANSVTNAGIAGKITMPIMDSTDYMNYSAVIDQQGNFLFTASMPEAFDVPLFVAQMKIYRTSSLTIQKADNKFEVLATLNGEININAPVAQGESTKGFKVDGLKFENMQIGSMDPYFRPGIWSLGEVGVSNLNGFSLTLSNVEGFDQGNDVGVKFTATVKLSGDKYVASTTLKVIGTRYSEVNGEQVRHKLKYKKTELQDLYIKVDDAVISLEGYLAIYRNDATYGNGFAGMIRASIIGKIGVEVKAVFGEVRGFKYWYADALANFSASPIPIFTGISMYGIGGGAYYHMSQATPMGIPFSESNIHEARNVINYLPDQSVFLGFKATIAMGTTSPQGFNAIATFEIVFNSNGGVNEVMFYGQGNFMSKMDLENPVTDAPIRANVYIGMDFVNDVFYGNFKVYVNACHGTLTGINADNLAGEMVIYADPTDWYIHIGRPSARIGLKLEILGFTIQNGSYFMMGTQIEEMPPPPEQVLRILDIPLPDNRNEGEIRMAKGFAFGTYFSMSTPEKPYGIFYASFDMGLGFDVMLSDMGETYCSETGEKIGMNGWYAQGQLYAFLEGSIGIDITVFTIDIHQEILDIGAAILLEAKLPNPFWMRGTVGGYYSLLGGRVRGNCRFQLELGNQCTLMTTAGEETSPVSGLDVISELSPGDGRSSIDVFATPQAIFNYQIGVPFSISDDVDDPVKYKVILDDFKVQANGQQLPGAYDWNTRGDVLVFNPRDILPGTTNISVEAKVHFEKFTSGSWHNVTQGSQTVTEIKTAVFETGEAPDYIPESNVAHSYPLPDMMNLYRNEFSYGYIQLNRGQEYLFQPGDEWAQYGRFTPVAGGDPIYIQYSYNAGDKKVNHLIPASLQLDKIYRFELVNLPATAAIGIDANIVQQEATTENVGGDITMTGNVAESERNEKQEKVIYTCYFRTSRYTSLSEKVNAIERSYSVLNNVGLSPSVFNINSLLILAEPFDEYELVGHNGFGPLLKIWASTDAVWLEERQIPFIYADYPIAPTATIRHRDTTVLGFIPVRQVYIDTWTEPYRLLTQTEREQGVTNFTTINSYLNYNLSPETWYDFQDIASALSMNPGIVHPRKTELLTQPYPSLMVRQTYPVNVQYVLPFAGKAGTRNTINIGL